MALVPLDDSDTPPDGSIKVKGGKLVPLKDGATYHGKPELELHRGQSWPVWAAERGIEIGGATLGGLGGGAVGAIPAISEGATVVGIPAAAATEYAAVKGGEAAGLTGADIVNAYINNKVYGRPIDPSMKNIVEDYMANLGGTVIGGVLAKPVEHAVGTAASGFIGKSELVRTARTAAEKATTEGAETQEKLAGKAATEAETLGRTAEQKAGEVSAKAAQAQQGMPDVEHKAAVDVGNTYSKAHAKLTIQAQKDAREESIQGSLGRTTQQTQAAVTAAPEEVAGEKGPVALPSQDLTTRRTRFYDSVYGPKNRAAEELGNRFNKVFAPHLEKEIDGSAIGKAAQDELDYAGANGVAYSRPTQKLLEDAKDLSSAQGAVTPQQLGIDAKAWRKLAPSEQQLIMKRASAMRLKPSIMTSTGVPYVSPHTGEVPAGPTIGKWLGLRSRIGEAMASADGPNRAALNNLREQIDQTLSESDVPGAKELRAQYRGFKTDFGKDFYRAIGKASDPSDAGDALFSNPQRFLQLATGANPDEKGVLRETFADWVNRPQNGTTVINREMAPALKALGFTGALAKPEGWIYTDKAVNSLADLFENAPAAKAKYMRSLQQVQQQMRADEANQIIKEGLKDAKALGPTGDRIAQQINAARTPEEKAQVALKAFASMSPEAAGKEAGQAHIVGAPKPAQQALQQFQPPDPTQAAVAALRGPGPKGGFAQRWAHRAEFWAILAGGTAALGHPSAYAVSGLAMGVPIMAREGLVRAYRYSVTKSPQAAEAFARSVLNPGLESSQQTISRMMIESSIADAMAHGGKAATGIGIEQPPKSPSSPGPMVKHIEEKKAENIAGPRGAVSPTRISTIQDTSKQIAAGSAPDIQADLRNGRLSHSDVAKMLKPDKPGLAALFQGLTPQQAVDAFAHADEHEREVALPALAQHLQDSKLKPEQMKGILAQLKAVMAPQQQEGEEV